MANPAPFPGDLMTADAFVLRYRLRPLLAGQLEVERLALEKPALNVLMDAKGGFNYEKLGGGASAGGQKGGDAAPGDLVRVRLSVAGTYDLRGEIFRAQVDTPLAEA